MEDILEILVYIWCILSVLYVISFIPPLRKKTKLSNGGKRYESGKNVRVTKHWDGNYDVSTTSLYSYTDPIYSVRYSALGVVFKSIGMGGISSLVLYLIKDWISEMACICTLGMVDVRGNNTVVYGCILGISVIVAIITAFCTDDE